MHNTEKIRHVEYHPAEFLEGVTGEDLGADGIGVYWLACSIMYARGQEWVDEALLRKKICAITGSHGRTVNACFDRLIERGKLFRKGAEISAKRVRNTLETAVKLIRNARENGAKGGRPPKKTNDLEKAEGLFSQNLTTNHKPVGKGYVQNNLSTALEVPPFDHTSGELENSPERSSKKKGSRLTTDWTPKPETIDYAIGKGLATKRIDILLEEFRNYWIALPGQKGTKLDWDATFRNRVLAVIDREGPSAAKSGGNGSTDSYKNSPDPYRRALYAWVTAGEKGPMPEPKDYATDTGEVAF